MDIAVGCYAGAQVTRISRAINMMDLDLSIYDN